MSDASAAEDLERVRAWFAELARCVRAVDFVAARHLFAEDMVAFGTFSDLVVGREAVERQQWRSVWPFIADFRWRLEEVRAFVAADRLSATGLACFDSTGFSRGGERYERPGRATVAFRRAAIGEPWTARHTHMSLFRGVPQQSFGAKA